MMSDQEREMRKRDQVAADDTRGSSSMWVGLFVIVAAVVLGLIFLAPSG
jgi:hypothetical protein